MVSNALFFNIPLHHHSSPIAWNAFHPGDDTLLELAAAWLAGGGIRVLAATGTRRGHSLYDFLYHDLAARLNEQPDPACWPFPYKP